MSCWTGSSLVVPASFLVDDVAGRDERHRRAISRWSLESRRVDDLGFRLACYPVEPMKRPAAVLRAISIRQPYVELILRGIKRREYRSRPTNIRGRVYVYASMKPAEWPREWRMVGKHPGELPTGVVVGSVDIVDCRWDDRTGCYAYRLEKPRRLRPHRTIVNQPQPCFWRPHFRGRRS